MPLTVTCSSKSRLVLPSWFLPFWYLLTRVVPDKFQKSSKTTVCVCVLYYVSTQHSDVSSLVIQLDSLLGWHQKDGEDTLKFCTSHPKDLGLNRVHARERVWELTHQERRRPNDKVQQAACSSSRRRAAVVERHVPHCRHYHSQCSAPTPSYHWCYAPTPCSEHYNTAS